MHNEVGTCAEILPRILLRERRGKPEYPGKNLSVETSD